MHNRYYRISPPSPRLPSRETLRSHASIAWLASTQTISVILLGLVTGVSCAPVFTPTTLQTFKESRTITSTTALERPRLALSPHSDGMGWTVGITQLVEETNRIRREEVWGGFTYERRLNLVTMMGGGAALWPKSPVQHRLFHRNAKPARMELTMAILPRRRRLRRPWAR